MFEKSCRCQVHRTWYRLHASSPEAEVSTYSTEFDGSQDFSNTLYEVGICHALQKPVLLVDRRVPFRFEASSCIALRLIRARLQAARKGTPYNLHAVLPNQY